MSRCGQEISNPRPGTERGHAAHINPAWRENGISLAVAVGLLWWPSRIKCRNSRWGKLWEVSYALAAPVITQIWQFNNILESFLDHSWWSKNEWVSDRISHSDECSDCRWCWSGLYEISDTALQWDHAEQTRSVHSETTGEAVSLRTASSLCKTTRGDSTTSSADQTLYP